MARHRHRHRHRDTLTHTHKHTHTHTHTHTHKHTHTHTHTHTRLRQNVLGIDTHFKTQMSYTQDIWNFWYRALFVLYRALLIRCKDLLAMHRGFLVRFRALFCLTPKTFEISDMCVSHVAFRMWNVSIPKSFEMSLIIGLFCQFHAPYKMWRAL